MSYIGNTQQNQSFVPQIDYFSGNGVTTAFTLSRTPQSVNSLEVIVANVPQNPTEAFTLSGNVITFTSAPPSGTNNIYIYYSSPNTQVIQPSQGTIGAAQLDIANLNGTGAMLLPSGTTAQRPGSPIAGEVRYNSTLGIPEWYDASSSTWLGFPQTPSYGIEYLVVAGGGGGGGAAASNAFPAGGGGAGGLIASSGSVQKYTAYSVTVGGGGAGYGPGSGIGTNGSNSVFSTSTAIGGGGGGGGSAGSTTGQAGGSGGGSGPGGNPAPGGSGTAGQGYAGGAGSNSVASPDVQGGGGGAGSVGYSFGTAVAPNGQGGIGVNWLSLGTYYAGGGGAGTEDGTYVAVGGTGGGGNGGAGSPLSNGSAGTANTGGGGGGAGADNSATSKAGGQGGSGIVIIRYAGAQKGSGGTVTSAGGYTYHTFTSSGTFTA